ncbi:MAG: hypothetical protein D6731_07395 [Planctomycetota bacterium]|nr:MAG: hypothetical protein D6731_07395 [Planctomycetota bacterium]
MQSPLRSVLLVGRSLQRFAAAFEAAGLRVVVREDPARLGSARADVVCVAGAPADVRRVRRRLPLTPAIYVVPRGDESCSAQAALEAGAYDVLARDASPVQALGRLRAAHRYRQACERAGSERCRARGANLALLAAQRRLEGHALALLSGRPSAIGGLAAEIAARLRARSQDLPLDVASDLRRLLRLVEGEEGAGRERSPVRAAPVPA